MGLDVGVVNITYLDRPEQPVYDFLWAVAQALVAFMGFPGEAKDKIRFFFDGKLSSEAGDLSYKEIYKPGLDAAQLLLPACIYEGLTSRVNQDNQDKAEFDWLDYARLHLLWLAGELLRMKYTVPRAALFDKSLAQRLIHSVDDWLGPLYLVARFSIADAAQRAKEEGKYRGHRDFFRSPANCPLMKSNLPHALSFAKLTGSDTLAKLPNLS
ncbi:MAG: hypothetical protein EXR54_09250 [Dehalococcoidia bacterium]|nr:hypothetical protein [Dehalococcoidia bacterium]